MKTIQERQKYTLKRSLLLLPTFLYSRSHKVAVSSLHRSIGNCIRSIFCRSWHVKSINFNFDRIMTTSLSKGSSLVSVTADELVQLRMRTVDRMTNSVRHG